MCSIQNKPENKVLQPELVHPQIDTCKQSSNIIADTVKDVTSVINETGFNGTVTIVAVILTPKK